MLHDDIETPLVRVLAKMEVAGIGVDRAELQTIADCAQGVGGHAAGRGAGARRPRVQRQLDAAAAHRALRRARPHPGQEDQDRLLDRRPDAREPAGRTTRSSRRCSRYREVEKLRSTYGESLLAEVAADGRIHASFGQTVARTGRISSDRPNLHNIPVRTEQGKQFRRAFVPAAGSHASWWPTTTRSSCGASPTSRRTPA